MNRKLKHILLLAAVFTTVSFCSAQKTKTKTKGSATVKLNIDSVLTISSGDQKLLTYQFKTVYPPAGQDTNYKRSGFIHPLYTPHGQVLTRIQPPDHYHHYGIWNAWTHTFFEGDTVDFWNIKGKQGTVRFAKFTSKTSKEKYAEYTALQEHVVFKKDKTEKIALNEWQTVRVYNPVKDGDYYVVENKKKMQCASQSPLLIVAYRYAGFGWRATEYLSLIHISEPTRLLS